MDEYTFQIALLVLGILSMIFDVASIALWVNSGYVINNAPGIYSGIGAIVTGSLNLAASKAANNCNVVAGLILSILLCFSSAYMTYWEITAVVLANTLKVTAAMATHALATISGLGIFISACFSSYFGQKTRQEGLGA